MSKSRTKYTLFVFFSLMPITRADDLPHTQHSHPFYFLPDIFKKLQTVKNREIVES